MPEIDDSESNPAEEIFSDLVEKIDRLPETQREAISADVQRLRCYLREERANQEENRLRQQQAQVFSQALNEINQIIHSSLDIQQILALAISAASKAIQSDSAALSLRKDGRWLVSATYAMPEGTVGIEMNDDEERHAVLAIQTRRPVAISDTDNDERVNRAHMRKWGIRSVLVMPVILSGEAIGVLFFNYHHAMFEFQEAHLDFAMKLSAAISLAIQNTELYQNLKQDIARRERVEAALLESQERLKVALASVDLVVYSLDRDLRYTWIYNPRSRYGFNSEQILARRDDEILPAGVAGELLQLKQAVLDSGQGSQTEIKMPFNGGLEYILLTLEPLRGSDGLVAGVTGASLNVTLQHQAEAERKEAIIEKEIHHRIIEQRERERLSYAREIHDGPIQMLSSATFSLQIIKEALPDPDPALREELDQLGQSIKNTIHVLRNLINELRPPSVIRFGLAKAIQTNAEELRKRKDSITWHFNLAEEVDLLPEQLCLDLYRIYQEAVNNILRHSRASEVWVDYLINAHHLTLKIRDNGAGFPGAADMAQLTQTNHFGLAGITERVQAMGGDLDIRSEPGCGTLLEVRVKIP